MLIAMNMFDQFDYILCVMIVTIAYTNAALPHDDLLKLLYQDYNGRDNGDRGGYVQLHNEPYNDGQFGKHYDKEYMSRYGRLFSTDRRFNRQYIRPAYGSGYRSQPLDLLSIKGNGGYQYDFKGPVPVAITSKKTLEVLPVHTQQDKVEQQVVDVSPFEMPVKIVFNTRSSPVYVQQNHIPGGPGKVEETHSEEEPHKVFHEVRRPVIQEVREIISPYRKVVQEILPVEEKVQTIVSKSDNDGARNQQRAYPSYKDYKARNYEEETKLFPTTTRKDDKDDPLESFYVRARVPLIDSGLGITSSGSSRTFKITRLNDDDKRLAKERE